MKKNWVKALSIACVSVIAVACLALVACGGSASSKAASSASASGSATTTDAGYKLIEKGKLKVVTSAEYTPMEFMENGEIKGFDIDIMKEVGKRMGLDVSFDNQAFDTLITSVAGGSKYDCSISAITINDERLGQVSFSDPYYDSNLAIVVMADSDIASKDALATKSIGAQAGSSGEEWAKENLKGATYTPFQETPDLLQALRTGKLDAAIYDEPVAKNHVSNEYKDCKILEIIPTGEQYGIAINKDNAKLVSEINKVIAEMKADGTYDKISAEWFGATK